MGSSPIAAFRTSRSCGPVRWKQTWNLIAAQQALCHYLRVPQRPITPQSEAAQKKTLAAANDGDEGRHFTVDARAMLTWGRDSIKDHTTAVLELVKNGYDAGASIVEVEISVGENLTHDSLVRIADDGCGMS